MNNIETRWLYTNAEDFDKLRELSMDTCVIPMGCSERHSNYLPLGTDIIAASTIVYEASKLETFCVFPDFTFGQYPNGAPGAPKGTITISIETELALLEELCEQIARNGFKKIIIYNGHGGNYGLLYVFMQKFLQKKRNYCLACAETILPLPHNIAEVILKDGREKFPELNDEDVELILKYHKENFKIGHACMSEAAHMLAITPENVHLDRLGGDDGAPTNRTAHLREKGLTLAERWYIEHPTDYSGDDAIGLNERMAKATLRFEIEKFVEAVRAYKNDTEVFKWQAEMQKGW